MDFNSNGLTLPGSGYTCNSPLKVYRMYTLLSSWDIPPSIPIQQYPNQDPDQGRDKLLKNTKIVDYIVNNIFSNLCKSREYLQINRCYTCHGI